MNARQAKRLLNVARALRESPKPEAFTMSCYIRGDGVDADRVKTNWCGSPGCALGHYANRTDLQRLMQISNTCLELVYHESQYAVRFDHVQIQDHFGIDRGQCHDLFGSDGCGGAKTPIAAAKFIEKFVKTKYNSKP
jgi:hypothetical protein